MINEKFENKTNIFSIKYKMYTENGKKIKLQLIF